jgi:acyl-CoA thioesterase I
MFDSLRSDATARLLFLAGALLLLITLALGVYTVLLRPASEAGGGGSVAPSATSAPATSAASAPAPGATGTTALTAGAATAPPPADTAPPATATLAPPTETAAPPAATVAPATATVAQAPATAAPATAAPAGAAPGVTPLGRPIVYSAIGASDTVGVGATNPATEAWPAVLAARLPPGTRFNRYARGGILLSDALNVEVGQAIASKPNLVTVWLAANDFTHRVPLTSYQEQLATLLTRLTSQTDARIVLLNLPDLSLVIPPGSAPGGADEIRRQTQSWNVTIGATAAPFGNRVLVVDLFPRSAAVLIDSSVLSGDNWHPSTRGYQVIADFVYSQIEQAGLIGPP